VAADVASDEVVGDIATDVTAEAPRWRGATNTNP
jgi:hypothetical protein